MPLRGLVVAALVAAAVTAFSSLAAAEPAYACLWDDPTMCGEAPPASSPPPPPPPEDQYEQEEVEVDCGGGGDTDGGDPLAARVEPEPDVVDMPDGDGRADSGEESGSSTYEAVEAGEVSCSGSEIVRLVPVASFHVARGMLGRFEFRRGKDTESQIAVSFDGTDWTVGGGGRVKEAESRSVARAITKRNVDYHAVIYARYVLKKFRRPCGRVGPNCRPYLYRLHHWTADFGRIPAVAPRFDPTYASELQPDERFWRDIGQNRVFERGFSIFGVGLDSKAGYSTVTRLYYAAVPGCRHRYLFGTNATIDSADVIHAHSTGCS